MGNRDVQVNGLMDRECQAALPQSATVVERTTSFRIVPSLGRLTAGAVVAIRVLNSTPPPNQEHYMQLAYLAERYPALERSGGYSGDYFAGCGTG